MAPEVRAQAIQEKARKTSQKPPAMMKKERMRRGRKQEKEKTRDKISATKEDECGRKQQTCEEVPIADLGRGERLPSH